MPNLTKTQNTIILVALENFLSECKKRKLHSTHKNMPEFQAQVSDLIDIYNNII